MRDQAAKSRRHTRASRTTERSTDLSVLTPPVGLDAVPETAGGQPATTAANGDTTKASRKARAPTCCLCGHPRAAHEHYRRGSDCGICGVARCASYRRRGGFVRRILRRIRLAR